MKYLFRIYVVLFLGFSIPCIGQQSKVDSLNQVYKERLRWEKDLNKIIDSAYFYRFRTYVRGGGQGSYIGYKLPEHCDSTEFGTYSIYEILPEQLVIQANLPFNKSPLLCVIDSNGNCNSRMSGYEYELEKIGTLAYQYRIRPASDGGGGGSYEGFHIPARYEWTAFGRYTIKKIQPVEITIQVNCSTERMTSSATFTADGKRWTTLNYTLDLRRIESVANQYRTRSIAPGGGSGSYIGFTIPHTLDSTSNGKYSIRDIQPDKLVLDMHLKGQDDIKIYIINAAGNSNLPEYHPRGNPDDFIKNYQAMTADIKVISKQAADYWMKSRIAAGMRGSFDGFTIPISLGLSKNGTYSVVEIRDDMIYIQAISAIGPGTTYFSIDNNGIYRRLLSDRYYPPATTLKNNTIADPLAEYKNADGKLNEVYQQLLAQKKSDKVFIKKLKNAERLWINYRDARLLEKYPKVKFASDKSMLTNPQLVFLTIMTTDRIRELLVLFDQP